MNSKAEMTSRERVTAALKKEEHDRVPWIEGIVEDGIASRVCGQAIDVDWSIAPDGLPVKTGGELAEEQKKVCRVFGKDNINYNAFAPIFAYKMEKADSGPVIVGDGMIKSEADYEEKFKLPPVDDDIFIQNATEFIEHKEDYCAIACVRLGIGATLLSMGIEAFSYAMVDNRELIRTVHGGYAKWTQDLIPILEDIGFDCFWAFDDVAFSSGPIFSPEFYKKEILPVEKRVTQNITIPFITHSDGDMNELLDIWVEHGQDAIHPIQPDVMDIYEVRKRLADSIGIVGNIEMDLLAKETPEQVEELILDRFEKLKPTKNYLISSSNSITNNMKEENVKMMIKTIEEYGYY